jgi:hypothetical protein
MPAIAILLLLALACPAWSGVVSRDLFEPGDGLLSYDDIHHREWLDFSVTSGLTFEDLNQLLESSPALSGFRIASDADVLSFFQSGTAIGSTAGNVYYPYPINEDVGNPISSLPGFPEADFIELMGIVGHGRVHDGQFGPVPYTGGRFSPAASSPLAIIAPLGDSPSYYPYSLDYRLFFVTEDGEPYGMSGSPLAYMEQFEASRSNYWLSRKALSAPEPLGLSLALTACLATFRLRAFA